MSARFTAETASITSQAPGTSRFAFLFPGLPPQGQGVDPGPITGWLTSLGNALVDDLDASGVPFPAGDHPTLPTGTTCLGQFIDHDLTLDPTTLPTAPIDISTLNNFRSPALDLDSLLGFRPRMGALPLQRTSIRRSPAASRRSISGQSGRSHANNARLEQFPMRIQTTCGGAGLRRHRSGKSSSFVTMTAPWVSAYCQITPSSASRKPTSRAAAAS